MASADVFKDIHTKSIATEVITPPVTGSSRGVISMTDTVSGAAIILQGPANDDTNSASIEFNENSAGNANHGYRIKLEGNNNLLRLQKKFASTYTNVAALPYAGTTSGAIAMGGNGTASALFSMVSTTRGFLPPQMSTAQMNAISAPTTGLMVFNSTSGAMCFYNGTSWMIMNYSGANGV